VPTVNEAEFWVMKLGANYGILSTASLLLGVATAHATHANV
jgi:hypothetical protein